METIRIFHAAWHIPHTHQLFNIPNTEWFILQNNVKRWNYFSRPMPENVHYVPHYEPCLYDVAVLDVDQQCVDPRIGKGNLYRQLNNEIQDIPKIVINHGTPCWPENWESAGHKRWSLPLGFDDSQLKNVLEYQRKFLVEGGKTLLSGEEIEIDGMEKMVGRNKMVVNSFKSREQWGWGKVIIHGLNSDEWWDLPKSPRSVSMISTGGLDYYYGRDFLNSMINRLAEDYGLKHTWVAHPAHWTIYDSDLLSQFCGWDAYRDFIGRSMIFFNPTRESCMPRARTEAMLSGCCILTTAYQDEDKFISGDIRPIWAESTGVKDFIDKIDKYIKEVEINGFLVPENPLAVATLIHYLIYNNPKECLKIGQRGKQTAIELFHCDRFNKQWRDLLESEINKFKEKNENRNIK
jgi:hypothetical protein